MESTYRQTELGEEPPNYCRLSQESAKAYAAFRCYCGLPPSERSVNAAYRAYREAKSGKQAANKRQKASFIKSGRPSGHFHQWYTQFHWKERAQSYDEEQYAAQLERDSRIKETILQRQAEESHNSLSVFTELRKRVVAIMEGERIDELSVKELLDVFIKATAQLPKLQEAERMALSINPRIDVELKNVELEKATKEELQDYVATGKIPLSACRGTIKVNG